METKNIERGNKKARESIIKEARNNVYNNKNLTSEQRIWLISILNILNDGGYARVLADNCLIDIMDVSNTPSFCASFYDVYNNLNRYMTRVMPIRINKIVNDYHKLSGCERVGFELF